MIELKIQKLEMREDLGALMLKDVIEIKHSGEVIPALFYLPNSNGVYTFYTRNGGKSIKQIATTQNNTIVEKGKLVLVGYKEDIIWPHNSFYPVISGIMTEAGI